MVIPIGGGIGLATRKDSDPTSATEATGFFPDLIRSAAQSGWDSYHQQLVQTLRTKLGQGDMITQGVTLYDLDVNVARTISLSVDRDLNGDLLVHLTVDRSSITATSTTPTDLGSWADPRFSFAFGLDLVYRIAIPRTTGPLTATGFESIHVLAPDLDSQNFVADVVFMINALVEWFSGDDYISLLEEFIAETDFAPFVNGALGPLNEELSRLAAAGYWFLEAAVDRLDGGGLQGLSIPGAPADRLDLLLTAYGFDLSGSITGTISWPRTLGAPSKLPDLAQRLESRAGRSAISLSAVSAVSRSAEAAVRVPAAELVANAVSQAAVVEPDEDDGSDVALSGALTQLAPAEQAAAAVDLKAAVASRFVSLVGVGAYNEMIRRFIRGRDDFTVTVRVAVGGEGLIPDLRQVGELAYLWADDDDTTYRRNYQVINLPIDAALHVGSDIAAPYQWRGGPAQVVCTQDLWNGTVTIRPAGQHVGIGDLVRERIEVGGRISTQLERAGLNPQPLPPRERFRGRRRRFGEEVGLNPQPLPPREVIEIARRFAEEVQLNPQPIPPGRGTLEVEGAGRFRGIGGQTVEHGRVFQNIEGGIEESQVSAVIEALTISNPSGEGTVAGIDFKVEEYVPPIVR
jgi:hypothetical protein